MEQRPGHAVVVGAGIAGLLTASVLTDRFQQVTLIERDELGDNPSQRQGIPQARHAHALLDGGRRALALLLPSVEPTLLNQGTSLIDWGHDFAIHTQRGWLPRRRIGVISLGCGRGGLEQRIRRAVLQNRRVTSISGTVVSGLRTDPAGSKVIGVRTNRGDIDHAQIVVDATGRSSKALRWLGTLGYPTPRITMVRSGRTYASQWYRAPARRPMWRALLNNTWPPDQTRGAVVYPSESGTWCVTLVGACGDDPPIAQSAWYDFAGSLQTPDLANCLRQTEPISPIWGWRRTETRIVHCDQAQWPSGLLLCGDTAHSFNPVHAQGMSVTAVSALALRHCLATGDTSTLHQRFHRAQARVVRRPLLMTLAEDLRWEQTARAYPGIDVRHAQQTLEHLASSVFHSAKAHAAFLGLWHLLPNTGSHLVEIFPGHEVLR